MARFFRKLVLVSVLVMLVLATLAGPAFAAKPNHRACFGTDVSGYAIAGGGLHYLPPLVQAPGPWGQVIQAHQAGFIQDTLIANSCND